MESTGISFTYLVAPFWGAMRGRSELEGAERECQGGQGKLRQEKARNREGSFPVFATNAGVTLGPNHFELNMPFDICDSASFALLSYSS